MFTMEKIMPYLLSPYTGIILFVIALGYVVRATNVENRRIPAIGIASGSIAFVSIIPLTVPPPAAFVASWFIQQWIIGVILSAVGWMIHYVVLSKVEEWLAKKVPAVDDWLKKTADDPKPENKP